LEQNATAQREKLRFATYQNVGKPHASDLQLIGALAELGPQRENGVPSEKIEDREKEFSRHKVRHLANNVR